MADAHLQTSAASIAGVSSGAWAAGGFEQVHPFVLAVPAVGQVHGNVPAAVPAVRSRLQVMAASAAKAALAGKEPDGRWGERPVGPVGEDLLGLGLGVADGGAVQPWIVWNGEAVKMA